MPDWPVDVEALVAAVSDRLRWNVVAYGKAWTGEDEDTRFIVAPLMAALTQAQQERERLRERLLSSLRYREAAVTAEIREQPQPEEQA